MTLVREPGSEILAQFTVPTRGTWLNTAAHTVPLDAVYTSSNVFIREGKLQSKPGLVNFSGYSPVNTNDNVLGGMMIVTAANRMLLAVTQTRLHSLIEGAGSWVVTPATTDFAPNIGEVVDTAFLETSSQYIALFAHSSTALKKWAAGVDTSVDAVVGTNIPSPKSICISSSRVIALILPHTLVWSRVLNHTIFDPLAIVKRAQTADVGVCVRSLSALSFVLYKENSIHTARAQAGLDEGSAFAFSEPIIAEGPAGVYAVVDVNGAHIYMTKSGRIAIFDGTNYPSWIADGIWFFLQSDIQPESAFRIRGVYDHRLNVVVFYYRRILDEFPGAMTGMVIINLPFPGFEAQEGIRPHCFLGITGRAVTHAYTSRLFTNISRAIVFTTPANSTAFNIHQLSETATSDAGVNFTSSFQTGLQAAPDARHVQTTTESFLERATGYGTVSLTPVTSHTLETPGGTVHTADAQTISLEIPVVNEYIGFNKKSRFFGFLYSWLSTSKVRYSGTVVYDSVKRRK